ncbi:hypothetical protein [Microbulbifer mangrovi]|uniref:hypothetical protein n=1 Tax=Microbulbifer mangrovi TaxID=927787 RepID=UPI00117E1998|nr:hypothetical protein [Microbulbifer mangrovi]
MKLPLLLSATLFSCSALADSCWLSYAKQIAAEEGINFHNYALNNSDLVFIGEATYTSATTSREKGKEEHLIETYSKFEINKVIKGNSIKKIAIHGRYTCSCRYKFEPGVKYIVLATFNEKENSYETSFCEYISPAEPGTVRLVERALSDPS